MTESELLSSADLPLMQGLAQRVTATRPDLISAGASYGEPAWIWGKGRASYGAAWPRRLWFSRDEVAAWGLYSGLGFRELSRDAPLVRTGTAG